MRCPSCIEPGTLTCTGCKNVKYCSVTCQQTDWQFHKVLCKTFRDFEQRPSSEMRRVIFFPPTATKPEFHWLPVKDVGDEETGFIETVAQESLIDKDVFSYTTECTRNNIIGATLDKAIAIRYDECFLRNYSAANSAVLAATKHKVGNVWRGPIIAYCGKRAHGGNEIVTVEDMDLNSYSDLVAFLIDYHADAGVHSDEELCANRKGSKIPGLRSNCVGEQRLNGSPYAEKAMIPSMHSIFDKGEVSDISKRIGMPLLFWRHAGKIYPVQPGSSTGLCNEKVTFMMLACDSLNNDSFGLAPLRWTGGRVPNVLVARLDRQSLDTSTFEAFADFCRYHMQPYFEWSCEIGGLQHEQARRLVMDEMTPTKWDEYLLRWRACQAASKGEAFDGDGLTEAFEKLEVTIEEKERLHSRLWDQESHPRLPNDVRQG